MMGLHILVASWSAFIFWLRMRNRPLFKLSSFTRVEGA